MKSLAIDSNTNDLLIANNNLYYVSETDYIKQKISTALLTIYGEWFLDVEEGIKYFEYVWVKNPNLTLIESIFKSAILRVKGVTAIDSFSMNINTAQRQLTLTFSISTVYGAAYLEETL